MPRATARWDPAGDHARLPRRQAPEAHPSATFFTTMTDFTIRANSACSSTKARFPASRRRCSSAATWRARRWRHLQHAARQRPDLVLRGQQLPARQGSVPVRPAVLELGLDPHAGGDAQLLPAHDVHGKPPDRPGGIEIDGTRSTSARSRCRATSFPRSRITSRRGRAPYMGARRFGGRPASCSAAPAHRRHQNPPAANKYGYWLNPSAKLARTADAWLEGAQQHPGSWWTDWQAWVTARQRADRGARSGEQASSRSSKTPGQLRQDPHRRQGRRLSLVATTRGKPSPFFVHYA